MTKKQAPSGRSLSNSKVPPARAKKIAGDREAEPGEWAIGSGRCEWLEESIAQCRSDATPVVLELEDHFPVSDRRRNIDPGLRPTLAGLRGIHQEIEQRVLEVVLHRAHGGQ